MTVKRRLPWPGWAGAVDEELAKAGGALPWKRLRALVVLRYRDQVADGGASSDDGRSLGDLALASVPEAYTSICDDLVRLPPATSAATAGSKDAESWPHWVSTCREELQRAGGALKWKVLQELLVARYLSATGSASGSVDMQVLRRHALAQIPEEYLSEEDRFVRLPSAADAAPPQSTSPTEGKASIASKLCLHITPCGDEASASAPPTAQPQLATGTGAPVANADVANTPAVATPALAVAGSQVGGAISEPPAAAKLDPVKPPPASAAPPAAAPETETRPADLLDALGTRLATEPVCVEGVLDEALLGDVLKKLWDCNAMRQPDWKEAWKAMKIPEDKQSEALQKFLNMAFAKQDLEKASWIIVALVKAHVCKLRTVGEVLTSFGRNLDEITVVSPEAWQAYSQFFVHLFPKPAVFGWGWSRIGWSWSAWWSFIQQCIATLKNQRSAEVLCCMMHLLQEREGQPLAQAQVWTDGGKLQKVADRLGELGVGDAVEMLGSFGVVGLGGVSSSGALQR